MSQSPIPNDMSEQDSSFNRPDVDARVTKQTAICTTLYILQDK